MKSPNSGRRHPWRAFGWVSAISADLIGCMAAGYLLGSLISKYSGGQRIWVAIGVILGLFAGILSVILLIKRYMESSDE